VHQNWYRSSFTWRRHQCRWRAAKFRPMLGAQGLWAGRDLLSCHTYCDMGLRFFLVSSEGPPHTFASYDTHGDAESLFYPGSSQGLKFKMCSVWEITDLMCSEFVRLIVNDAVSSECVQYLTSGVVSLWHYQLLMLCFCQGTKPDVNLWDIWSKTYLRISYFNANYLILIGWEKLDKIYCRPLIDETMPKSVQKHNNSPQCMPKVNILKNIDWANFMCIWFAVDC
jgi:hypothetical protein